MRNLRIETGSKSVRIVAYIWPIFHRFLQQQMIDMTFVLMLIDGHIFEWRSYIRFLQVLPLFLVFFLLVFFLLSFIFIHHTP